MITDEIGQFLADNGLGTMGGTTTPNGDIWGGAFPDQPDDVVVIQPYGGLPIEVYHDSRGVEVEHPRVQIRVRDHDYGDGAARMQGIFNVLGNLANMTLSGTWYRRVLATQSPFPLERDDNGRYHFVCNFQVEKALST